MRIYFTIYMNKQGNSITKEASILNSETATSKERQKVCFLNDGSNNVKFTHWDHNLRDWGPLPGLQPPKKPGKVALHGRTEDHSGCEECKIGKQKQPMA